MVQHEHHLTSLEEAKQHYEYYRDKLTEIYSSPHCSQLEAVETEKEMNIGEMNIKNGCPLKIDDN